MRTHELKCWPSEFGAIERGDKRFEYRRNDRDFARGDTLVLRKWDPYESYTSTASRGCYVNERGAVYERGDASTLRAVVTHLIQGRFGVPENYCVMSIELLPAEQDHA